MDNVSVLSMKQHNLEREKDIVKTKNIKPLTEQSFLRS